MKTITIGDIHGRDSWKRIDMNSYDKVIFIGDYVDSYDELSYKILYNLIEIIELKKKYPNKVVLLIGNHDSQYMFYPMYACSGFREEDKDDLITIFNENIDLFQVAYQEKNYLWTHAGVSTRWYKKYSEFLQLDDNTTIADKLNLISYSKDRSILHEVGAARGGDRYECGGPLWADINETRAGIIDGYHQIVGHTSVPKIVTYFKILNETYTDKSLTFVDCLDKVEEFYIKDI